MISRFAHKECITKLGKNAVRQETIGLLGRNSSENGALVSFQNGYLKENAGEEERRAVRINAPSIAIVPPGLDRSLARIWGCHFTGTNPPYLALGRPPSSRVATMAHQRCVIVPCHAPSMPR
jgi:hypothetical protein